MATVTPTQAAENKSATWPGGEKASTECLTGCRAAYDRQQQSGGGKK